MVSSNLSGKQTRIWYVSIIFKGHGHYFGQTLFFSNVNVWNTSESK